MATENIDIRIREDGSRVVRRNIDDIGSSAERSAGGVDMLKKALGALGTVLAVNKLRQYADTWSDLNSRVKLATGSHEAATAVMGRLTTMARRTYSSLEQTAEGYLANATALKEMGLSTEKSLDYVEALNNALVVSGAKSERAASVSDSLSKAMMLGKLSGQNLNTVISSGGRIAELLAEQLGVTTSELLALGQQGKITGEVIQSSLIDNLELLREEADSMPATIGDAFILLENGLMAAIGKFDEMTGASSKVADLLIVLADNMELVTAALLSIGAAVAVAFAPGLIMQFAAAIKSLWVLLAANPFIALAGAISAAVTFVALYGDEMNAGIDATTSLKDVMRAFVEEAVELWDWLTGVVMEFFTGQEQLAADAANGVTAITEDATSTWMDSYSTFYDDVGEGFAGVLRGIARTVDAITGLLLGLGVTIGRTFGGLPDVFRKIFARVYNTVVDKIEALVNATIHGMNRLRSIVGKDPIELINLERKDVNERAFAEYGEHIGKSFDDAFGAMMEGGFEARLNNVFDRAQRISRDRLSKMAGEVDLSGDGGAGRRGTGTGVDKDAAEKQRKELERLEQQFRSLLGALDPIRAAQMDMAEAQDTLNKAMAAGIINAAEHARYSEKLAENYKDILDPLGKLNRELEEQAQLLGMNARERELEAQLLAHTQQLQQAGVTLTKEETQALRDKLKALQELNAVVQEQDTLLANSVGKRQQFTDQIKAIQNLLADTGSGFTRADALGALESQMPDMFAGTEEAMELQLARHEEFYRQIDELRQADLISEQTASQMKAKADIEYAEARMANMRSFFGNLAVLSKSENRKVAAIGKAAAITQATIDGVLAVQKALASAPPPANYALAASVGVATAANVAQIAGLGFQTGGQFTVGGSGGADSQLVAFRASPGEKVRVDNPRQVRKGDDPDGSGSGKATPPQLNVKNINVLDPSLVGDYLGTDEGEQLIMNVVQRNQRSISY